MLVLRVFSAYIKIRLLYYISQRYQTVNRLIEQWFGLKLAKTSTALISAVLSVFKYAFVGFGLHMLTKGAKIYLSDFEILSVYFLVILVTPVAGSLGMVKRLLAPLDEGLLAVSPLSNRQIFLLNYIVTMIIKRTSEYIYLFIFMLVIWGNINGLHWSYWVFSLLFLIVSLKLSFCMVTYFCLVQVNRYSKGYGIGTFFYVFFWGFVMLFITFFLFKTVLEWLASGPDLLNQNSLKQLLEYFFQTIQNLLQLKKNIMTLDIVAAAASLHLPYAHALFLTIASVLFASGMTFFCYKHAGQWYRGSWTQQHGIKHDWLWRLEQFYLMFSRDVYTRIQVKNLFRSRQQLASDYAFFFFNYFNYIWIGIAVGASQIHYVDHPYMRLILLFMLFNIISRDSFGGGGIWFPGILKFDSDGRALQLYRISGVSLLHVYKAKIRLQRWLGMFDFIILFLMLSFLLHIQKMEWLFIIMLSLLNYYCIPHLKTLPSFIMPRPVRQHYTEVEDYVETELWQDKVEKKIQQAFVLVGLIPSIGFMVLSDKTSQSVYLIGASIFALCLVFGLFVIRILLKRQNIKINKLSL